MMIKKKILFVCLGNICRSPAAEEIFRTMVRQKGLEAEIDVYSAGTYGGHAGDLPDVRMREAAAKRGYHLTSRSRKLRADDFGAVDQILVMDDMNYEAVNRLAPDVESVGKIYRMSDYCLRTGVSHVPDPYYEGRDGFERVLDILEDGCANLLKTIKL